MMVAYFFGPPCRPLYAVTPQGGRRKSSIYH